MSETGDKEKRNKLMEELAIRTGLREKLFYFYGETFQNLHRILETAEDFDFYISMHATSEMIDSQPKGQGVVIHVHEEIAFNARIILQDILDDYWAAYLCFQNGFTKQAQEILRNTLELLIELYYLQYVKKSSKKEIDNWVSGIRGIEQIANKLEALKQAEIFKRDKRLRTQLDHMYGLLSKSTHSHKERMASINMPRMMMAKEMPSFEPYEILYTKGFFFSLLDVELHLIRSFLKDGMQTDWIPPLTAILSEMIEQITLYKSTIEKFEKGYLVHNEFAKISSTLQILYSVRLDGSLHYPERKKPKLNEQQLKTMQTQIQKRLLKDTK